jgi:DNA-binding IclR family transcriptional regulator
MKEALLKMIKERQDRFECTAVRLARWTGYNEQSVSTLLKKMTDAGELKRHRSAGTWVYQLP